MGTTLTGTTPQDTYDSLIKVTDNGPLSGTAKYLSDGLGNDSALALSNARVGIGTASPAAILEVRGAATQFRVGLSAGGFVELSDNQVAAKTSAAAASDLYLNVSGANTILNRDSGNVGIGTSSPSDKLSVAGNGFFGGTNAKIYIDNGGVGGSSLVLGCVGTSNGYIATDGNFPILIQPNNTTRVRIDADGLKFNADTAAANALDDYEEGTWTMGVSFGDASVGVTYAFNTGTYTKIGRQVTVNGYLALTGKGSSTGFARITGLPFTIANTTGNLTTAALTLGNITFANQFQSNAEQGTTKIVFSNITEAGVLSYMTDANFANNSNIMVNLTYFV